MRKWFIELLFGGMMLVALPLQAQVTARVAGLEGNAKYMTLLKQEHQLHQAEDSVMNLIAQTRKAFAAATAEKRNQIGQQILTQEGELFDIRNHIGEIVSAISVIEQEYVVQHMGTSTPAASPTPASSASSGAAPAAKSQRANLVYNTYFKDQLTAADYQALCKAQERELLPPQLIARYVANYEQLDSLAQRYLSSPRAEAEQAYARLKTLQGINVALSDSIDRAWSSIYDNKIYAYNYLLDKMNKNELLSNFEHQFKETNQRIATARDSVASDVVYGYPLRKRLIMAYEIALADQLGYTQAHDSLTKAMRRVDTVRYHLTPVNPAPRNFIEYSKIEVTVPSKYNTAHPIPQNEVFAYGTVYKIQIGTFQRKQPVSLFRNVSPLCYDKLEDGDYRYCAGAYRDLSEAQQGLAQMKKLGFRSPVIVVWRDGVFESLGEESSESSASESVEGPRFRVEIADQKEELSPEMQSLLKEIAPNKEVARTVTPEGGFLYTVGTFEERSEAEQIAEKLRSVNNDVITVQEIK